MIKHFNSLEELMIEFRRPQSAIKYFTAIRWKNGKFCPYCHQNKVHSFKKHHTRKGYWCGDCGGTFSITVGTIFENTKLPLQKWFGAIWLLTNHPKGIASTTLARDLNVTQGTAWFMLHRLRYAARTGSFGRPLKGDVEVDETFIGGKSINKHGKRSGTGGGHGGKSTVVGAVERGGEVVAHVIPSPSKDNLQSFVHEVVSEKATMLVTDANPAYTSIVGFPQHKFVNHSKGQRTKGTAHTNTIEGVWAQLKRQISGTHHWVSPKHLEKYVDEMTWRMNRRAMTAAERVNELFTAVEGRLTYKALVG